MRTTLMSLAVALAFVVSACGSDEQEPVSSSGTADAQALQERVAALESEAKRRDAEEARKLEAVREEARAARREVRKARRERTQRRERAAAQVDVAGGGIVVPDVTGLDHQAAQDAMQGEGLWVLDEKDCTGQGRMLLFDRNWEVVSTDPPAGTQVSEDATITICSKKQGE
jgi:hypothetical protein